MSLRILHVVESLAPEAGSIAISLAGLSAALTDRGLETATIAIAGGDAGGIADAPRGRRPVSSVLLPQADVIHVHGWRYENAGRIARTVRKAGSPFVISPLGGLTDGPYNKRDWWKKLRFVVKDGKLIRRAAIIAALNNVEKEDLEARKLNNTVEVLPYGLCVDEYESEVKPRITALPRPEDRVLLMLAPIHPAEGLVPLLKAFAEIGPAADGWAIAIAGPEVGDWRRMLEAAVRRKGGSGRVRFVSAPDVTSQREWLARASVLVAPSLHIRSPISIMQAMAAGVPVIASDRIVPDGFNGAVEVCPPSREAFRQTLRCALERTQTQQDAMGRRGREMARSMFDWSKLVARYVKLYEDVAQRG